MSSMQERRYRGIPLESATIERIEEAERTPGALAPEDGPLLWALARLIRPLAAEVVGEGGELARVWLAAALPDRDPSDASPTLRFVARVGNAGALESAGDRALLVAGEGASIDGWARVAVGRSLALLGAPERLPGYLERPVDRLLALLLPVMRPATIALGPDVVFDGALKPRGSRVHFSGMGGQIAAGDLLIVRPAELGRYEPLPGAAALVLGTLESAPARPTVPFEVEGEPLALVIG